MLFLSSYHSFEGLLSLVFLQLYPCSSLWVSHWLLKSVRKIDSGHYQEIVEVLFIQTCCLLSKHVFCVNYVFDSLDIVLYYLWYY